MPSSRQPRARCRPAASPRSPSTRLIGCTTAGRPRMAQKRQSDRDHAPHRAVAYVMSAVPDAAEGWATKLGGIVLPTGSVRLVPSGPVEALAGWRRCVVVHAAQHCRHGLGDVAGQRVADLAPPQAARPRRWRSCRRPRHGGRQRRSHGASAASTRLNLTAETAVAVISTWTPDALDAILLDAPCSATGTIRRHPDVAGLKRLWAGPRRSSGICHPRRRLPETRRQKLVFCTCSPEPEEGPGLLHAALAVGTRPRTGSNWQLRSAGWRKSLRRTALSARCRSHLSLSRSRASRALMASSPRKPRKAPVAMGSKRPDFCLPENARRDSPARIENAGDVICDGPWPAHSERSTGCEWRPIRDRTRRQLRYALRAAWRGASYTACTCKAFRWLALCGGDARASHDRANRFLATADRL